jgi:hypothetical protein
MGENWQIKSKRVSVANLQQFWLWGKHVPSINLEGGSENITVVFDCVLSLF